MENIFISHSADDDIIVRRLATILVQNGKQVWIDGEGIKSGESLPQRISDALEKCEIFVLLWSKNAASSKYVNLEWNAAWNHKRIIPLCLDGTPLPFLLQNTRYVDFRNFDNGMSTLLKDLN